MPEKCPLGRGLYWDEKIPDGCTAQCEAIWESAMTHNTAEIDLFDEDCNHQVEFGGESLQRAGDGARRAYGILNACVQTGEDVFAEEYFFECPFE